MCGIWDVFKEITLSIFTRYIIPFIPSMYIPFYVSPGRLFLKLLKLWSIAALFLYLDEKLITVRYSLDSMKINNSFWLPFLVNKLTVM